MMSLQRKLDEFPPWCVEEDIDGQFLLVLDKTAGGMNFPLTYLLLKLLKQQQRSNSSENRSSVLLVSCNSPRKHYESILRKNNLDMKRLEATGSLRMLFLSNYTADGAQSTKSWDDLQQVRKSSPSMLHTMLSLAGIDLNKESASHTDSSQHRHALIIDDLESLEILVQAPTEARRLMSELLNQLKMQTDSTHQLRCIAVYGRHPPEYITAFPTLLGTDAVHADTGVGAYAGFDNSLWDEGDVQPALAEYLRYRADVIMTVRPLDSGYSSTAHGIAEVVRNNSKISNRLQLQFKALDSGVHCIAIGRTS